MLEAVILSDIHLGNGACQAKLLCSFLEDHLPPTKRLLLNGDVFDSFDFRRLTRWHWRVLSSLRRLSDSLDLVWIAGNHDGPADLLAPLLGAQVVEEYVLLDRILVLHGHQFDDFLDEHPVLTWLGDTAYSFLLWLDTSHTVARAAKHSSKTFLRCAAKVRDGAVRYAGGGFAYDAVCCGHTHHAEQRDLAGEVGYHNSGCWTELPCTYLTVDSSAHITLEHFSP